MSNCLYLQTAEPYTKTPQLRGDTRTQVVIVGGGVTGLSAALHLAERAIASVVLEAFEPGWGASGRNGGQVNPGLHPDPSAVIARFGPNIGQRMLGLAARAPQFMFDLIKRYNIPCEAEQSGSFRLAFSRKKLASTRQTFNELREMGASVTLVGREEAGAATGTDYYSGGIFFPEGGQINPLSYTRGLARAATAAGAQICCYSPALAIEKSLAGWDVLTAQGRVRANQIVMATDGYTDALWPGLQESIVPVYSTVVATTPLPDEIAASILPSRSVAYEAAYTPVYFRLDQKNRLLFGGRGLQRDARSLSDARHLKSHAKTIWPQLQSVEWTHVWSGLVAVTTDHYVHLHEPAPHAHICLGYNGRGLAMATAMGHVLAERIGGMDRDSLPFPVTDVKPVPFHGMAKIGVGARIAYGRLRDSLGL